MVFNQPVVTPLSPEHQEDIFLHAASLEGTTTKFKPPKFLVLPILILIKVRSKYIMTTTVSAGELFFTAITLS